jgi:hypothetical protein
MKTPVLSNRALAGQRLVARAPLQRSSRPLHTRIAAGFGFTEDFEQQLEKNGAEIPKSMYGLSYGQMAALGLTDSVIKRPEPRPVSQGELREGLRACVTARGLGRGGGRVGGSC